MSRHEGVSCDACLKSNFSGLRHKCLICYDYDLCATCYGNGATSSRHTTDHAMQCILTRADINLYYGGDTSITNQPQSYTCSYCGRMGFTVVLLQEHIRAIHGDSLSTEVVCPVCAAHPGGDPNHVTDDLATHIALVHRSATEFNEDDQLSGIRQIRRLTHPVRTSNFGSRPNRGPVMQLIEPPSTGMSPTGRDSMDPIAELLSQLTSVRSRAAIAQGMTSHLQQFEMHQALAKHQSERMSQRQADSSKTSATSQARTASESQSAAAKPSTAPSTGGSASNARSQFLLVRCTERTMSDAEKQQQEVENADKSLFIQELLLSSLIEGFSTKHDPLQFDSSLVESNVPPTELVAASKMDSSSHLVNGESSTESYPATTKSCNIGHLANDRSWDLSDAENWNSPADTSEDEAGDEEAQGDDRGSAATETHQKESRLL